MCDTYAVRRFYMEDSDSEVVAEGLSLDEAQEHCRDPETSSSTAKSKDALARTQERGPWFEGYEEE